MKLIITFTSAVIMPVMALGFVLSERLGLFDWYYGHDLALAVAARLETSYSPGVQRQFRPSDKEWEPMLRLIDKYSTAELRKDKPPRVLARSKAISSEKIEGAGG